MAAKRARTDNGAGDGGDFFPGELSWVQNQFTVLNASQTPGHKDCVWPAGRRLIWLFPGLSVVWQWRPGDSQ